VVQLIFSLLMGLALLAALYVLVFPSPRARRGGEAIIGARQALTTLQLDLLPPEFVSRLFSAEDFDYVAAASSEDTRRLFLRQRRKIALLWAAQVQNQVLNLKRFHLGRSRFYSRLSVKAELSLALRFAELTAICRVLRIIIYARGPHAARPAVHAMAGIADRVCAASAKSLDFLAASRADGLSGGSAKSQAVL